MKREGQPKSLWLVFFMSFEDVCKFLSFLNKSNVFLCMLFVMLFYTVNSV